MLLCGNHSQKGSTRITTNLTCSSLWLGVIYPTYPQSRSARKEIIRRDLQLHAVISIVKQSDLVANRVVRLSLGSCGTNEESSPTIAMKI